MRRLSNGLALAACVVVGAGCGDSTGPNGLRSERFEWSGQVALGDQVEVKGNSGSVTFTQASGSTVEVDALKTSQRDDVRTVTIEVVQHAGGVTICAVYPNVPGQAPNECLPGTQGNLSSRDTDVSVDFTVRVPPGRGLAATMVSGSLSAIGVQNEVKFTTVSGNIVIGTTEIGEAAAVSGNVTASIGRDPSRNLNFAAVSGNVTITVPAACNAFVEMATVSGSASSGFALTQVGPRQLEGTLGIGGATINIASVSGNVRLARGS